MPIFIFWSIIKLHFGLTEKSSIYSWTKALLTKSSQHFTYLFIHTKHTFSIAMRPFCQELAGKSSQFHGFPVTKVHNVSHGPVKRWFFHLVNAMFGVRILQIFVHIYPYKTSMQITIYLGLWRIWFWTDSVNAAFASPNFCTYLSIQKVYAYYNILGTKKNFVLNRFGQCIFCSLDSLNFRTYLSIQNIYANYNILFWWIRLPYFQLYAIRTCITLIMFVWILAHSCFRVLGTMLGTFLVNKPVLH